jgi:hypothetical protein
MVTNESAAVFFEAVLPHLDERQRRIVAGAQARIFGYGGVAAVSRASGLSLSTVQAGAGQVDAGIAPAGRVRGVGAGRPRAVETQPGLAEALDALVEPESRGDPMCPLRWTAKSTRALADELAVQGFEVSHPVVADMLRESGYSLQSMVKAEAGAQHPDRDAQFRYISSQVTAQMEAGGPVISVDAKKKELVGEFANAGREWQPSGEPVRGEAHDFPDPELGKAVPYGVYDLRENTGWVTVGSSADTAQFAVATIRQWWDRMGSAAYPGATRLLITADAGGSNSYRVRLWKKELAEFAAETGMEVAVCHFPPGTSKWNKIEHRLFSHITMNWRGRPLESHEVIVNLIANTTTSQGLRVRAELDRKIYPKGIKVSDSEFRGIALSKHDFHGEWNYTISGFHPESTE